MLSVTSSAKTAIAGNGRTFKARITAGRNVLDSVIKKITFTYGSCGAEAYSFGSVFSSYADITLSELDISLADQEMFIEVGVVLSNENVEYIPMGYFTAGISDIKKARNQVSIKGSDRLATNKQYLPKIEFPATIQEVIGDIETQSGLTIETSLSTSGTIEKPIEGTIVSVLSVLSGLLGGFCYCDRQGVVRIAAHPTSTVATVNEERCLVPVEAGEEKYTIDTLTVTVPGEPTDSEEEDADADITYTHGSRSGISVENAYMTQELFDSMKGRIVGYSFDSCRVRFMGDPTIEQCDAINVVNYEGRSFFVPCMSLIHEFDGGFTTEIATPAKSSSDSSSKGPLQQAVENLKIALLTVEKLMAKKISAERIDVEGLFAQDITAKGDFNLGGSGALIYDAENDKLIINADQLTIAGDEIKLPEEMTANMYRACIVSKNGSSFKAGSVSTILSMTVQSWDDDITEDVDASQFKWTRVSGDTDSDIIWNNAHAVGSKTVTLTNDDVDEVADFTCVFTDDEGNEVQASYTITVVFDGKEGDAGKGVSSITNYYLATSSSSGVTRSTSGWTIAVQAIDSTKKYLWNYEEVTYTNDTKTYTEPCIIGTYGETGNDGKSISTITEYYAVSKSNSTKPTSWSTTVPTLTATNKYLWNYEVITFSDGSKLETEKKVIGVYGDTGLPGNTGTGVSAIVEQYYLSSSKTSVTGGSWSESQPEWKKGYYIWTRSKITWTDGTTSYTDPVLAAAINGANESVNNLDASLDQEEVFNRLTNGGATQGLYIENGKVYINASYIKSGKVKAAYIDVADLFAQNINASGSISGAKIISRNNSSGYTVSINNGSTKYTMDEDANAYVEISGYENKYCATYNENEGTGVYPMISFYLNGTEVGSLNSDGLTIVKGSEAIPVIDFINRIVSATEIKNIVTQNSILYLSDGTYVYFRPDNEVSILGSSANPWYNIWAKQLNITGAANIGGKATLNGEFWCKNIYDNVYSGTSTGYLVAIGSGGRLRRSSTTTSSKLLKHDIYELGKSEELNAENLYDVDVVQFKYNNGYLEPGDIREGIDMPGFIIENLESVYPIAVDKMSNDVKSWSWNPNMMIPPMLKLIQEQNERLKDQESRIRKLEKRLNM
jgi:hypothetical protein